MMPRSFSHRVYGCFRTAVLLFHFILVISPFVWIFLTSLKTSQGEIYAFPVQYLPKAACAENYIAMLWKGKFATYMLNSFLVSGVSGILAILIGVLSAYALSRFQFRAKNIVVFFFFFSQMLPTFILLPPLYNMLADLSLLNNRVTLIILYTNMMIPFSVVTLQSFLAGVPRSIDEAAQIDGCGPLRALFVVIAPVLRPGIAATFVFAFINAWNELFMAVMFIDRDDLRTIPVGLNALVLKFDIKWGEMSAGIVMALIPSIILFALAQRHMVEGLSAGAVKG